MSINNPFAKLQLSSGFRPNLKAVINLKRRSPISIFNGRIPQQEPGLLRASKSEKALQAIFNTGPSRFKIKVSSLPPLERSNTEDKRNPETPKFKSFSADRKKNESVDKRVKRNGRIRFFDHVKKRNLVDVSFNENFKSFYNEDRLK